MKGRMNDVDVAEGFINEHEYKKVAHPFKLLA